MRLGVGSRQYMFRVSQAFFSSARQRSTPKLSTETHQMRLRVGKREERGERNIVTSSPRAASLLLDILVFFSVTMTAITRDQELILVIMMGNEAKTNVYQLCAWCLFCLIPPTAPSSTTPSPAGGGRLAQRGHYNITHCCCNPSARSVICGMI